MTNSNCPFCGQQHEAERDEARTWANRASRALFDITVHTGTTFDPINPEAVAESVVAELTKLRAEIARLHDLAKDPVVVELNLKAGRAMPRYAVENRELRIENEQLYTRLAGINTENERLREELDAARRDADEADRETERLREAIQMGKSISITYIQSEIV